MLRTTTSVEVQGLSALNVQLEALAGELDQRKALRKALGEAGRMLRDAMLARVPHGTGTARHWFSHKVRPRLHDNLKVRFKWDRGVLKAYVGFSKAVAYIANWLELTGVKEHLVGGDAPGGMHTGKMLTVHGLDHPVEQILHHGFPAHPFMRPAWDECKMKLIDKFKLSVAETIQTIVRRHAPARPSGQSPAFWIPAEGVWKTAAGQTFAEYPYADKGGSALHGYKP